MLTALLKAQLREYRTHRLARFTAWELAYGAALWTVDKLAGGAPTALWVLFWIAAVVCGVYYLGRLLAFARHRLLWRLRRRLIVTYVFIAFVPIVLILVLAGLGAFILNGQFAAYLVASNLREHFDELQQVNRVVAHEAPLAGPRTTKEKLDWIEKFYSTELEHHAISYPSLEITLRMGSEVRAFRLDGTRISTPITLPAWFKQEEFSGIVVDDGRLALRSIERRNAGGEDWTFILSEAFTPELLDMVGEGVGPVGVEVTPPTLKATPAGTPTPGRNCKSRRHRSPTSPRQASLRGESACRNPPAALTSRFLGGRCWMLSTGRGRGSGKPPCPSWFWSAPALWP